ncbi:MAG: hypothetical protein ACNA7J_13630, partial [Wenzhouxiangella sp.]
THGGLDLISFGPSAISQVGDCFAQNQRKLDDWAIALLEGRMPTARGLIRTVDDRLRAEIIDRIMCTGEVVFKQFEKAFQLSFKRYFTNELDRIEALSGDGLVERTAQGFKVTSSGLIFLRAIAKIFDSYLTPSTQSSGRFSRIV